MKISFLIYFFIKGVRSHKHSTMCCCHPASPLNPPQTSPGLCLCHPHLTPVCSVATAERRGNLTSSQITPAWPQLSSCHRHFMDGEADTPDNRWWLLGVPEPRKEHGLRSTGLLKATASNKIRTATLVRQSSLGRVKPIFKKEYAVLVRWHTRIQAQAVICNMFFRTELLLFQKPV